MHLKDSLSARSCHVYAALAPEEKNVASKFIAAYHTQGAVPNRALTSICLDGPDGSLVGVMQFCAPRTSAKQRQYSVEMVRMCFAPSVRVVGGASKMMKAYIRWFDPHDIFTYQDTTGQMTDVYEHCGMTLVSQDPRKQYLVAPGIDFRHAVLRDTMHTLAFAVERGPDAILGTTIGEQFHPNGQRKTNIELFRELGWTVHETTGDRVFEWLNPNRVFYVYRITATDSDKWYVGQHHLKQRTATEDEMVNDGYWGGGGTKYQNWAVKHQKNLVKTILGFYTTFGGANSREIAEIGTSHLDDPKCLNTIRGGIRIGRPVHSPSQWSILDCRIHGFSWHNGTTCQKCQNDRSWSIQECAIHGETAHIGETCHKCSLSGVWSEQECAVHGLSLHNGGYCGSCTTTNAYTMQECSTHGITKHIGGFCHRCSVSVYWSEQDCDVHGTSLYRGGRCAACLLTTNWSDKECAKHGMTKHLGGVCHRCSVGLSWSIATCPIHGDTTYHGTSCHKCSVEVSWKVSICELHGKVLHHGDTCQTCSARKMMHMKECGIHGLTSHRGDSCNKCSAGSSWSIMKCSEHGMTKHVGGTCSRCNALSTVSVRVCNIHGLVTHQGNTCCSCSSSRTLSTKECERHGLASHKGDTCLKCATANSLNLRECAEHGMTKHRGSSCAKCVGERVSHTRWHQGNITDGCKYCVPDP